MDAAGLDSEYYKSLYGLRSFAKDMLQNYNIDVTQAPDPRNPLSLKAVEMWNAALAQHAKNRERLKQAKLNQDALMKAYLEGNFITGRGFQDGEFGVLDANKIQQAGFSTSPKFIQEINRVLETTPRSEDELTQLKAFREKALEDIERMVLDGRMPPEAAEFYKSKIRPVGTFDDRLTKAKLASEEALRRQRNATARRQSSLADDAEPEFPLLTSIADQVLSARDRIESGPVSESGAPATSPTIDNESLSGTSLFGKGSYMFDSHTIDRDGKSVVRYRKDPSTTETITPSQIEQNIPGTKVTRNGDIVEIRFDKNNLTPIVYAYQTIPEAKKTLKEMRGIGILDENGRLTAQSVQDYARRNKSSGNGFSELKALGKKEFAKRMLQINPNITADQIKAMWDKVNN